MSTTETNTNNNASQTLFRFVSLRNPQLTKTDKTNKGFIYRPNSARNGVFDTSEILEAKENKIALLEARINTLSNNNTYNSYFFKTEQEVKNLSEQLFELGESIAKGELENTESLSPVNSSSLEDSQVTVNQESKSLLTQLWDNLIYQVLTQADFYVKEAIIQVLKAKHFSDNFGIENNEVLQNAKVVLPNELFLDNYKNSDAESSVSNIFTVNESNISNAYIQNIPNALTTAQKERMKIEAQKLSDLNLAKLRKSALENLKNELQNLQKSYQKSYNKAYKTAFEVHQETIAPIIQTREEELAAIEAQITDTTTEAQKQQLYSTMSNTEIPAFNFDYKNEINFGDLQSKISEISFNHFVGLFTETENPEAIQNSASSLAQAQIASDTEIEIEGNVISLDEDYQTYQNVHNKLTQEIDALSQTILSSSTLPQKQYAKIGSALVPVSDGKSATHLAYTMMANYFDSWYTKYKYLQFSFDVEDTSWSLDVAKITAETNYGMQEESYTDIAVENSTVTLPIALLNRFNTIFFLKIELFFTNGREAVLEFSNVVNNSPYSSTISLKPIRSSISGNSSSPFMPKHFGVKRLGIADYLKVEQSLHAYIPGEVSNIENVMASELRHKGSTKFTSTETTDTTNKTIETEHISDTATATRNEMQSEVSNVLEQDRNTEAHVSMRKDTKFFGNFEAGASYASHSSQQTSTRQAVIKAQEITNRALDRIVSKVTEERVVKIINQFTENNTHEFDNRGVGAQHISGVYRWVDKKMKNQIYNYGKRAMFEFMIPEPAKLHRLATAGEILTEPIDPRTATDYAMASYKDVTATKLEYWNTIYPDLEINLLNENANISFTKPHEDWSNEGRGYHSTAFDIALPENYKLNTITGNLHVREGNSTACIRNMSSTTNIAGKTITTGGYLNDWAVNLDYSSGNEVVGTIKVTNNSWDIGAFNYSLTLSCVILPSYQDSWRKAQFTKIIDAYTQAKADFDKKKADMAAQQKDQTENFYRDMEEVVLKHNCIAYLLQDYAALGRKDITNSNTVKTMADFKVIFNENLDNYTALAKFMEQAFEWNIMSYTFYPYYWGNKEMWKDMYTTESVDPLFRNFLQAGMARVIVTVKPGFEDAVQFFMNTGKIWNGGEVPVIGDPLYLSIVDELRAPVGKPQGKAWITRIPTTLNILQAKSIGLEVTNALPVSKENPADFEEPKDVETTSPFGEPIDITLTGSDKESTLPKIVNNLISAN